jgi:alkanesulfonate monooxygenase SsuD/methylene tetrahydromethanopterin reductase-like flavin-dependent oxidoreductase (luciferase family)
LKYAVYLPTHGEFADVRLLADLAQEADRAGWDGFFIWDELMPVIDGWPSSADSWVAMAAIAMVTERLRFGALVTPVALRRPATIARSSATLDRLSKGRFVLGVGLGNPDARFTTLGEEADMRTRAEKTDEFLELLTRLWSGQRVSFKGKHYSIDGLTLAPTPAQKPHIPIWIGADRQNKAPLRRAARWEGFVPASPDWPNGVITADEYREMRDLIRSHRTSDQPFDMGVISNWTGDLPALSTEMIADYADAGVTWWLLQAGSPELARRRIAAGPPHV